MICRYPPNPKAVRKMLTMANAHIKDDLDEEAHDHVVSNRGLTSGFALDALAVVTCTSSRMRTGSRGRSAACSARVLNAQLHVTPVACTGQ